MTDTDDDPEVASGDVSRHCHQSSYSECHKQCSVNSTLLFPIRLISVAAQVKWTGPFDHLAGRQTIV